MPKIATIVTVLLLTTLASPLSLAKTNKLNFHKSQQNTEQKITGKLLYLNEKKMAMLTYSFKMTNALVTIHILPKEVWLKKHK